MNPVGFKAHSRWLSEATPPVVSHIFGSIPVGMPAATLAGILASLPGCSSVLWSIPVVSDLRSSTTGYASRPLTGASRCMTMIDRQITTTGLSTEIRQAPSGTPFTSASGGQGAPLKEIIFSGERTATELPGHSLEARPPSRRRGIFPEKTPSRDVGQPPATNLDVIWTSVQTRGRFRMEYFWNNHE